MPNGDTEEWVASISLFPITSAFWLFGRGLTGLIGMSRKKDAR